MLAQDTITALARQLYDARRARTPLRHFIPGRKGASRAHLDKTYIDGVAADVVNFDCAVRIDVRQAKDFPWVAALLSARVKKLDPAFKLQLSQALNAEQVPQLLLTPKS